MRFQTLDFEPRPFHHLLQVRDEFLVNRVVRGAERVERCCGRAVEDAEHAEVLLCVSLDAGTGCRLRGERNTARARARSDASPSR